MADRHRTRHHAGKTTTTAWNGQASLAVAFAAAIEAGLPAAFWRLPTKQQMCGAIGLGGACQTASLDFAEDRSGFVFAPFREGKPILLIPDDVRYLDGSLTLAGEGALVSSEGGSRFLDAIRRQSAAPEPHSGWHCADDQSATPDQPGRLLNENEFRALVSEAVALIHETGVAKVVASRAASAPLPSGFDPTRLFERLCAMYPDAFVSLVSIPGAGTWIGATPELLMAVEPGEVSTMALAGTQPFPVDGDLSHVQWGHKERVEQQMVSDYVREFFAEAGVPSVEENGPLTVAAGSIVHLRTSFAARVAQSRQPALANAVLDQLHPTSAVCGMPRQEALAFITAREGYDRAYYSGYLGPIDGQGRARLFVNLRCMQLQREQAIVYMGAGITAESDPATEWEETELKSHTMLDALHELDALDGLDAMRGLETQRGLDTGLAPVQSGQGQPAESAPAQDRALQHA